MNYEQSIYQMIGNLPVFNTENITQIFFLCVCLLVPTIVHSPYHGHRQEDVGQYQRAVDDGQRGGAQGLIRVHRALQIRCAVEGREVNHESQAYHDHVLGDDEALVRLVMALIDFVVPVRSSCCPGWATTSASAVTVDIAMCNTVLQRQLLVVGVRRVTGVNHVQFGVRGQQAL